jgi:hypothetical protein
MSAIQQHIGKAGEQMAISALHQIGVEQIEKIGTPVTTIRNKQGKISNVFYGEPVAADFRGVYPVDLYPHTTNPAQIGQSVMAEVKTILDRNLIWSDFRPHQPAALSEHVQFGGMSLVVWVHSTGIYVMRWPIYEFGPGNGITPAEAQCLKINE